jgi:hypothetical protein
MNPGFDRARLALLLLLVALLGVGLWAYRGVGDSLREIRGTGLRTLLNTQVGTLELWIAERRHEAEQLAADPGLRGAVVRLAGARDQAAEGGRIVREILEAAGGIGITATLVVDPRGRILAASEADRVGGKVTPDFLAHLAPVLKGQSAFVRPYRVAGAPTIGRAWVVAPVRAGDGKVVAAIALGSPADKGFAALFGAARPGESGEALAFDAEGWLLSPSRHDEELSRRQLPSRLSLPVGDAETPTRLAAEAVAMRGGDGAGLLLQPYPGYLGRDVIGAWRWLREHDIGVAIELEASEAYAPLTYLQIGFGVVLVLIFAVWLSGFLSPKALAAMLRRDGRARQMGPVQAAAADRRGRHQQRVSGAAPHAQAPGGGQGAQDAEHHGGNGPPASSAKSSSPAGCTTRTPSPSTTTAAGRAASFITPWSTWEGLSLADLVERYGPVPPARTAFILRQACASLWEAHSCGLVHRDIKPQNIMLCDIRGERDFVKVLDFGLVKQIGGSQTRDLTQAMHILGTPLYMSPERIRSPSNADARADIYALGAVGFYLLTGRRLFETETDHDLDLSGIAYRSQAGIRVLPLRGTDGTRCPDRACPGKGSGGPAAKHCGRWPASLDGILVHMPWTRAQIDAWWIQNWVGEDEPGRRFTAPKP